MEKAEHILSVRNCLGEGPFWQPGENALYWVDILDGAYQCYDLSSGAVSRTSIGLPLGAMRLCQSGGMVMATCDGFMFWDPAKTASPIQETSSACIPTSADCQNACLQDNL